MRELRLWQIVLLVGAILSLVDGQSPSDETTTCDCVTSCPADVLSTYTSGKRYRFSYESKFESTLPGLTTEKSGLQLRTVVDIIAISSCEFTLRLSDVKISQFDGSIARSYLPQTRLLTSNELRFGFLNGRVLSVCPKAAETRWSLNIKRAILSAFQSSENPEVAETKTETDISGSNCATNYTINERTASSITVSKYKDLTSCSQKYTTNSLPHLLQVFGEPLSALPFVRGKQQCTQVYALVQSGVQVAQTECTETHQFLTLNNRQQGPATEITTKLTFIESAAAVASNTACTTTRTTLKMDVENVKNSSSARGDVLAMVRSICQLRSQRSSTFETLLRLPLAFLELQGHMQTMTVTEFESLWRELSTICNSQQRTFIRKLIVDAVAMTQTDASVAFVQKLFGSGDLQLKEANILLDSLFLIMNPSEDMVKNMRSLLQQAENFTISGSSASEMESLVTKSYLLSSTLVSRFCQQFGPRCELNDGLVKLHNWFDRKLTEGQTNYRQLATVLKAIGNIGLHNLPKLENSVRNIIESRDYPIEVRLAALDTVRNVPCTYKLRSIDLAEILRRSQPLPLEMRIRTYLLLTRCPSIAMFSYVKDVILNSGDDNENSQLRSFVWTHLRNLESSQRQDVRSAWRKTFAQYGFSLAKFEAEFARKESFKLSRNLEYTFNLEGVNLGATLQSNLIWNPAASGSSSQRNTTRMLPIDLPQALGLNLTVNMFGKSVNLVELESRFVNMESFFDTLFTRVLGQFLKNESSESKPTTEEEKTALQTYASQQNIRQLEDSKRENRLFNKIEQSLALNSLNPDVDTNPDDQLGFDTSLRILGYEVRYEQFLVRVADTLLGDLINRFVPATERRADTSSATDGQSQTRSSSSSTKRESLFPNWTEARTKLFRLIATALKSDSFQYELTKTYNLLSMMQRLPTAFGAPLKLRLDTTALLDVALRGSLGSSELSQTVLQTTFTPVATLQLATFFGLEFTPTHDFGMQTETNLRSTMEFDVAMQMDTDQLFKFTWNVPKQKMDLFAVSSKVSLVRAASRSEVALQTDTETNVERTTCVPASASSQLSFGMKACFAYRLPRAFTTLTSPIYPLLRSNLSVVAEKTDTHTAYTLDVDYRNDNEMKRALFSFDMPGATVRPDRKLLFDGTLNLRQNSIKVELVSPWKRGLFEAMLSIDDLSFLRARVASSINGTSLFNVTFENRWSSQNAGLGSRRRVDTLTPRFSMQIGSRAPMVASGLLERTSPLDNDGKPIPNRASEVRADIAVDNLFKKQLFVRGVATYNERNSVPRYNVTLTFGSAWYNGRALGLHEAQSNGGCTQDFTVEYSPAGETTTQRFSMKNTYKPANTSFYFKSEWRANSWQRDFYAKYYSYPDGRSQHQFEVRDETATEKSHFLLAGGWNITQSNGKLSLSIDELLAAPARSWDYQLSTRHKQDDTTFDHRTTLRLQDQVTSLKLVYADLASPRGVTISSGTRIRLAGLPRRTVISDCEITSMLINARLYTRAVKTNENELALETAMRINEIGLNTEMAWYAAQTTARNGGVEMQLRFVDVDSSTSSRANMNIALSRLLGFEQLIAVARYELTDRRSMVDVEFTRNSVKYGQLTLVVEPDLSDARFEAALALLDRFELSTALNLSRSNELLAIGYSLNYRFGATADLHQLYATLVRQIQTDDSAQRRIRTDARVTFDNTDQVLLNYTLERRTTSYVNDFTLAYRPEVLEDGLIVIEWLSRNMLAAVGMRSARSQQTDAASAASRAMRRINLHADYDFDDGWTSKGLSANLRVQTPFTNWQDVAIRLAATGQLTAVKVDLDASVGLKRFAFNMELDPRSVFTDNTIKLRLITPWSSLSYLNTQFRYLLTASQYRIDILQEMNVNNRLKLSVNVEDRSTRTNSESNAERKRDYTLSLDFESYLTSVSNSNWTLKTMFKHLDDMSSAYETTLTSMLNNRQVIDLKLLSQVGRWISNTRIPSSLDSELRYSSQMSQLETFTYALKYRPVSDSTRNAQKFKLEHTLVTSLSGEEQRTTHTTDVDYRVGSSQPDYSMTVDSQLTSSFDSIGTNSVRFEFQLNQDGLNLLGSLTSPVLLAGSSPTSPAVRFTAQLSKNDEWSKAADGSLTWQVPFANKFRTMDVLFSYANGEDDGITSRFDSRWKHTDGGSEEFITASFGVDPADSSRSYRDTLAVLDGLKDMRLNVETSFSQLPTVTFAHKYVVRRVRASTIPQRESTVTLQLTNVANFQMRHKMEASRSGVYTLESAANVTQGRNTIAGIDYTGTLSANSLQVNGKVQSGTSISNPFKVHLRKDDKWYNATVEYTPASTSRSSRRSPQSLFLLNANYLPSSKVLFNMESKSGSSRLLAVLNYEPGTFEQRLVHSENDVPRFKLINVLANGSFLHEYENEVRPLWNYRQSKLLVHYGNVVAQTAANPNRTYVFNAEYNRRTIFAAQLSAITTRGSNLQHLSLSTTVACSLRRNCTHQATLALRNLNTPINIGVYGKYQQNDALVELEWAQRWINETNFEFSLKSNSTLSSLIDIDWFDKVFNTHLGVKWVVPRESNFSVALLAKFYNDVGLRASVDWLGTPSDWLSSWTCESSRLRYAAAQLDIMNAQVPLSFGFAIGTPKSCSHLVAGVNVRVAENLVLTKMEFDYSTIEFDWLLDTESQLWSRYTARVFSKEQSLSGMRNRETSISCDNNFVFNNSWTSYDNQRSVVFKLHLPKRWPNPAQFKIEHRSSPLQASSENGEQPTDASANVDQQLLHEFLSELLFPMTVADFGDGVKLSGQVKAPTVQDLVLNLEVLEPAQNAPFRNADLTVKYGASLTELQLGADQSVRFDMQFALEQSASLLFRHTLNVKLEPINFDYSHSIVLNEEEKQIRLSSSSTTHDALENSLTIKLADTNTIALALKRSSITVNVSASMDNNYPNLAISTKCATHELMTHSIRLACTSSRKQCKLDWQTPYAERRLRKTGKLVSAVLSVRSDRAPRYILNASLSSIYPTINGLRGSFEVTQLTPRADRDVHTTVDVSLTAPLFDTISLQVGIVPCQRSLSISLIATEKVPYFEGVTSFSFSLTDVSLDLQFRQPYILRSYGASSDQNVFETKLEWTEPTARSPLFLFPYDLQFSLDGCFMAPFNAQMQSSVEEGAARRVVTVQYSSEEIVELTSARTASTLDLTYRFPASIMVSSECSGKFNYVDDVNFNNGQSRLHTATLEMLPSTSSYSIKLEKHKRFSSWMLSLSTAKPCSGVDNAFLELGWSAPPFANLRHNAQFTFKTKVDNLVNVKYVVVFEVTQSYNYRLVTQSELAVAMPDDGVQLSRKRYDQWMYNSDLKHYSMVSNCTSSHNLRLNNEYLTTLVNSFMTNGQWTTELVLNPSNPRLYEKATETVNGVVSIREMLLNSTHFYANIGPLEFVLSGTYVRNNGVLSATGTVMHKGKNAATVSAQFDLQPNAQRKYNGNLLVASGVYKYADLRYSVRYDNSQTSRTRAITLTLDASAYSSVVFDREQTEPLTVSLSARSNIQSGSSSNCALNFTMNAPWRRKYEDFAVRTTYTSSAAVGTSAVLELTLPTYGLARMSVGKSRSTLELRASAPCGELNVGLQNDATMTAFFDLSDSETKLVSFVTNFVLSNYATTVDLSVRNKRYLLFVFAPTFERMTFTALNLTLLTGVDGWEKHEFLLRVRSTGEAAFELSSDAFPTLFSTAGRKLSLTSTNLQVQPVTFRIVTPFDVFPGMTIRLRTSAQQGFSIQFNVTMAKDNSLYATRIEYVRSQRLVLGFSSPQISPLEFVFDTQRRNSAFTAVYGARSFVLKWAINLERSSLDPIFDYSLNNKLWTAQDRERLASSSCPFRQALAVLLSNSSIRLTKTRRPTDSSYVLDVSYRNGVIGTNSARRTDGYALRTVITGVPRSMNLSQNSLSLSFELTFAAPRTILRRDFVSFWSVQLSPEMARITSRHPSVDSFRAFELSINGAFRPDTQQIDQVLRITYVPNDSGNRQEETFTAMANLSMRYDERVNQRVVNASFLHERSLSSDRFYLAINADYLIVNSQRIVGELEFIRNRETIKSSLELSLENFSKLRQLPNLDRNGIRKLLENRMVFLYSLRTPYALVKDMSISLRNEPSSSSVSILTKLVTGDTPSTAEWKGTLSYFFSETSGRSDWLQFDLQVPSSTSKLLYRFEKLPTSFERFNSELVWTTDSVKQLELTVSRLNDVMQMRMTSILKSLEKFRTVSLTSKPYSTLSRNFLQSRDDVQLRGYQFEFLAQPSVEKITMQVAMGERAVGGVTHTYLYTTSMSSYEAWRSMSSGAIISSDSAFTRLGLVMRVVHNTRTLVNTNVTMVKNVPSVISFDESRSQPLFIVAMQNGRYPYPSSFELKLFNYYEDRARATTYFEYAAKLGYGESRDSEPAYYKYAAIYYKSNVQTAFSTTGVRNTLRILLPSAIPFGKDRVVNYFDVSKDGQSGRLRVSEKAELYAASVEATGSLELRNFDVQRNVQPVNLQHYSVAVEYDNQSTSGNERHLASIRITTPTDRFEAHGDTRLTRFSQFGNLTIVTQSGDAAERLSSLVAKLDTSSDPHARSAEWIAQISAKLPSLNTPTVFRHALRTSPSKLIDGEMTLAYSRNANENWRLTYMMDLRDNEWRAQADVVQEFSRTNMRMSMRSLTQSFRDLEARFTFLTSEAAKEFSTRYALESQQFRFEINLPQYRLRTVTKWAPLHSNATRRLVGGLISSDLQYDVDKTITFNLTANHESSPQLVTRLASRVDGGRETLWSVCMDGRVVSGRSAQLRMYTERSGESTDALPDDVLSISLKQNADNQLGVYGMWRPKALERVYEFLNEHSERARTIFNDKFERLGAELRNDLARKRASLLDDYQSQLIAINQSIVTDLVNPVASELKKLTEFYEELRDSNQFFIRDIDAFVRASLDQVRIELESIAQQVSSDLSDLCTSVNRSLQELQACCAQLSAEIEVALQRVADAVSDAAECLYARGTTLLQYVETRMWKLIEKSLEIRIESFTDFLALAYDYIGQEMTSFIVRRATELSRTIENLVALNGQSAATLPLQNAVDFCIQLVMPFVNSITDALKLSADELRFIQDNFSADMYASAQELNTRFESMRTSISSLRVNLVPDDVMRYWNTQLFDSASIERRLSALFTFTKSFLFDIYGLEVKLRNALRDSFDTMVSEMKAEITEQIGLLRTLKSTLLLVDKIRLRRMYSDMDGEFAFEIYLPINLTSSSLREMNMSAVVAKFMKTVVNQAVDRWSIDTYFQKVLETVLLNRIDRLTMSFERLISTIRSMQTFTYRVLFSSDEEDDSLTRAVGLLAGDHVVTFDGRHYDLLSRAHCSTRYLLAHHVAGNDSEFSVFATQRRSVRDTRDSVELESMSIFLNGRKFLLQLVNERAGVRVILNSRRISMPQFIVLDEPQRQASVTKLSEQVYHVSVVGLIADAQLRVTVDFAKDTVSVALLGSARAHGIFYNRLVGVFGHYDTELYNDAPSVEMFTVETDCGSVTANERLAPRFDSRETRVQTMRWDKLEDAAGPRQRALCRTYFQSRQSPFHSCFRSVDPRQFYRMCLLPRDTDAGEDVGELEDANADARRTDTLCRTAEVYSRLCFEHSVQLAVPRVCMRCANGALKLNETSRTRPATDSRSIAPRVVFVLEESECSRTNFATDKLKQFSSQLSSTLQNTPEFAVIGVQGRSISSKLPVFTEPHVHAHHNTWTKPEGLDIHFGSDRQSHWSSDDTTNAAVSDAEDVPIMGAIELALKQLAAFESASSKHIIIASCNAARLCGRNTAVRTRIASALKASKVQLHVITKDNLAPYRALRSGLPDTATLQSFNATHIVLLNGVRGRTQEVPVEDACTNAIGDTSGMFINMNLFGSGTNIRRRQFFSTVAQQMAQTTRTALASSSSCASPVYRCRARTDNLKSTYFTYFDESVEVRQECARLR